MKVTLFGAAKEVTGSCYRLETARTRVLVDCGMFQGPRRLEKLNYIPSTLTPRSIESVLLTHGHLDHCGRLPLLVKAGYRGPIFTTEGTAEIASLILHDAAHIQENDIQRENRRRRRAGMKPIRPLFDTADVEQVCKQIKMVPYDKRVAVAEGLEARFVDAGHILGSASIEVYSEEDGGDRPMKVVFSGDVGPYDVPIMHDPASIDGADVVFMESTYGDRDHRALDDTIEEFKGLLNEAVATSGKVLIPTFAVGRAQQILYYLALLFKTGAVPSIPVFLDSPMAISATDIYARHESLLDEDAHVLMEKGQLRTDILKLRTTNSVEESQELNSRSGPCIILAGAGMCNAGRILHHFKHNLWREETIVIMVGYQARGSLGRMLLEGAHRVKINRETIAVKAKIHSIGGFSAHAGQSDLIKWLGSMVESGPRVLLTHGEPHQIQLLGNRISSDYGIKCDTPEFGETVELKLGKILKTGSEQ